MSWHTNTMLAFDLESTGVDPETARIVTAAAVWINPRDGRQGVRTEAWLADPGVDIPAEATAVHGIGTEHARNHGDPAFAVCRQVHQQLTAAWQRGIPVVIYNAPYDLTVLDRELRRHHGHGLGTTGSVVDPLVCDKATDRYRRGSRKLGDVCAHHGIVLDRAHSAAADALATARLAWCLAAQHDELQVDLDHLREVQAGWFADAAASFEDYLRRRKQQDGATQDELDAVAVNRAWPVIPFDTELEAAS